MDEWPYAKDLAELAARIDREPMPALRPARRAIVGCRPVAVGLVLVAVALAVGVRGGSPRGERAAAEDVVSVVRDGEGQVIREGPRTWITWEEGVVRVDVVPGQGAEVSVRTAEAEVRVVGTRFEVRRDVRGTHVSVERGKVHVRCATGREQQPEAGQEVWCLRHAGAALGLALSRLDAGAPLADVLDVIAQGLDHPVGQRATREALVGLEVHVLAQMGRHEEALARARDLIGTREREALATAVRIALPQGCDRALPFLRALDALGDAEAKRLLRRCGA